MLPQDPVMLLSYVNTLLRDNYSSPEELAKGLSLSNTELSEILQKLEGIGYKYNSGQNQFK